MADEQHQDLYDPRALQGDGNVEMVIFGHNGKIIQRFARPMLFVAYEPENMGPIVNRILGAVKEAGAQVMIDLPKFRLSKERRDILVTRAIRVYASMTQQKKAPAHIAAHVVDSILSELDT